MCRTAIRQGNPRGRDLWPLVFPFLRERFSSRVSFLINGIDWAMHERSHAAADDALATELLADLVCQTASDWELFPIALGVRYQGQARLMKIAQ
jgi:hypothetical protein